MARPEMMKKPWAVACGRVLAAVQGGGYRGGRGCGMGGCGGGGVLFVRGDACSSSGVAAVAPVRRDGGDRGHARAGGPGAGGPVDRGRVGGAGGHGAGPAAPVPVLGGHGAGGVHPAGGGPCGGPRGGRHRGAQLGGRLRGEPARERGLFGYSLVQELLEQGLSQAERGWRARELAGRVHEGPGGRRVAVSYATLTRWRRAYEEGGFDALVPSPRQPAPRTPEEVLALAEALKREKPGRTAAQVRRILQGTSGWAPSDRSLQRLVQRLGAEPPGPGPAGEQRRCRPV